MALYSVSLEFNGGTYLRQVNAASQKAALIAWSAELEKNEVKGIGLSGLENLAQALKEQEPAAVSDLKNVWCASAIINGKLALMHVTQTVE